jgi:MFS family permease
VIPFVLACVILACNQATGVNSIIGYNANILLQSGLSDVQAHWGYVVFTIVNFLTTMGGVALVDRKGRKFLLSVGSAGIIVSLLCTGFIFRRTERLRVDSRAAVQSLVSPDQKLVIRYDKSTADRLLASSGDAGAGPAIAVSDQPTSLIIIYSCGDFRAATKVVRSDDIAAKPIEITRENCLPANKVVAFFSNPFSNLEAARQAPLKIDNALISPVPGSANGWRVAVTLFVFMAFFAIGPGVCVWLALSELMPTRIRSNGMSIALLINQAVSTGIAATFLPTVGKYGYSTMFFAFAGCTVVYFVTAAFFLPETKGKTLEEIEAHFEGAPRKPGLATA